MWVHHLSIMAKFVIQHVRNQDSCGRRIQSLLAYHQMEAGVSMPFSNLLNTNKAGYLTESPIYHLMEGLGRLGIKLQAPHWIPAPGRTIMDVFLDSTKDIITSIKLNICRMHAKTHYITDMLTLDGRELLPGALRGKTRGSNWEWPTYHPPNTWWETLESYVRTYILPLLTIMERSSGHQIYPAHMNSSRTVALLDGQTYTVGERGHFSLLEEKSATGPFPLPCDIV